MDAQYRFSLICPRCQHQNDDLLATEVTARSGAFETICRNPGCGLQFAAGKEAMDNLVRTIELGMEPASPPQVVI